VTGCRQNEIILNILVKDKIRLLFLPLSQYAVAEILKKNKTQSKLFKSAYIIKRKRLNEDLNCTQKLYCSTYTTLLTAVATVHIGESTE
jgi:hypothetical protein